MARRHPSACTRAWKNSRASARGLGRGEQLGVGQLRAGEPCAFQRSPAGRAVAEHHNVPSVASTAPETLIAHLAASTERIRVGSGGVMLPNHSPLAVAERLEHAEALGTDQRTAMVLRSGNRNEFGEQFAQLRGFLGEGCGAIRAVSGEHTVPELWMLGSTDGDARIAGPLGIPFVFAHHFHPHFTEPALELYRELFVASELADVPRTIVAAGIVVGEDDEALQALVRAPPREEVVRRLRRGDPSTGARRAAPARRASRPRPSPPRS